MTVKAAELGKSLRSDLGFAMAKLILHFQIPTDGQNLPLTDTHIHRRATKELVTSSLVSNKCKIKTQM